MSAASALARGRVRAESLLTDTFTAYAPTVTTTGGMKKATYVSQGTIRGKIQAGSAASRDTATRTTKVGGVDRPVISAGLHVPLSAAPPRAGDIGIGWEYELTTAGPMTDPSLVGARFLVVDSPAKSYATARRLDVVRL